MKITKLAAIDIGSNAIRLLIQNISEFDSKVHYKKVSLTRVPVRLGEDSFTIGKISKASQERVVHTMLAFHHLMAAHECVGVIATATSAMRDAINGPDVVKAIFEQTKIPIHIISGDKEAEVLFSTNLDHVIQQDINYLFVDIGGGSTELTFLKSGNILASQSFNIGTIRVLHDLVKHGEWERMKAWIKEQRPKSEKLEIIGSGGNINRLYKMSGKSNYKKMNLAELKRLKEMLESYSYEERVVNLNLNIDRADVIIPAAKIITSVMKWSSANYLNVPKTGVADGLIKLMYDYYKKHRKIDAKEVLNLS